MAKEVTMADSLATLNSFLEGVRKEAAEEPNNTSFKDTAAATPAAMSNDAPSNDSPEGSRVSKEKTEEAEAAGGTVDSTTDNKDGDVPAAAVPETNQDTEQMDADTPVQGSGQMGSITHQNITQEQKVAALQRSIGIVTANLKNFIEQDKEASKSDDEKEEEGKAKAEPSNVSDALQKLQAELNGTQEADDAQLFEAVEKWASEQTEAIKEDMIVGALMRIQDEVALKEAMELPDFPKEAREAIEQVGGVSAFLDKVAMENPDSIIAPEVDEAEEAVEEVPEEAEMAEEVPAEGAPEVGEGLEELTEEDLMALEQLLAEAGVTEEDLAASQQDLGDLAEAGASPEEAAMAMDALTAEALGEAPEKVAAELPERVQKCVEFLRTRRDERAQG